MRAAGATVGCVRIVAAYRRWYRSVLPIMTRCMHVEALKKAKSDVRIRHLSPWRRGGVRPA